MAGRLIALDKNQGVRQIAIGEVLRQYPKLQYLRSHETGKWLQTPISYVMELSSLKRYSDMHCIFDIVEHHPIPPLIAMVVELFSIAHGIECTKGRLFIQRHDENQIRASRP